MTIDDLLARLPHLTAGGIAALLGYASPKQIPVLRKRGAAIRPDQLRTLAGGLRGMADTVDELADTGATPRSPARSAREAGPQAGSGPHR